jgi:DNA-binding NarL/FixJ family response regulator
MVDKIGVFIIDCNQFLRESWAILLHGLNGIQVLGAADDTQKGIELCSQLKLVSIMLINAQMPMTDSFETTSLIRQQLSDIGIVMLHNGYATDRKRARETGVNALLLQPVTSQRIAQVIRLVHWNTHNRFVKA